MNVRLAYQRMELLLYANFSPQDLFLTLTYSDDRLPQSYAESQKRIRGRLLTPMPSTAMRFARRA